MTTDNDEDAGHAVIDLDTEDSGANVVAAGAGDAEDADVANVDHYKFLGPNTPPPGNPKIQKYGNSLFRKGTAMQLLFGYPGLPKGYTHH